MATGPMKSTASSLKALMRKTGCPEFRGAPEKLDILYAVTERIKDQVEHGSKMSLTLDELNTFLRFEEMTPSGDAKGALTALWELRRLQIVRLGKNYGTLQQEEEEGHWLMSLDTSKLNECFGGLESVNEPFKAPPCSPPRASSPRPAASRPSASATSSPGPGPSAPHESSPPRCNAREARSIANGQQVTITGLKGQPELNGKLGRVQNYDQEFDRYLVHIEGVGPKKLKESNLIVGMDSGGYEPSPVPKQSSSSPQPPPSSSNGARAPAPSTKPDFGQNYSGGNPYRPARDDAHHTLSDSFFKNKSPPSSRAASPPPSAAPREEGSFEIGDAVRAGGLSGANVLHLNGQKAVVFGVDRTADPVRCTVLFEDNHHKYVKLKVTNLKYLGTSTGILAAKARMEAHKHQ